MIAPQINEALQRKGWSITEAAAKAELDRSFVSRLAGGHSPPRTKKGRKNARHDERYPQLARILGLDESTFVDEVVRLQRGFTPSLGEESTEQTPADRLTQEVWSEVRDALPNDLLAIELPELIAVYNSAGLAGHAEAVRDSILGTFTGLARPNFAADPYLAETPGPRQLSGQSSDLNAMTNAMANAVPPRSMPAKAPARQAPVPKADEFQNMTRTEVASLFRRLGHAVSDAEVPIDARDRARLAGMYYALATRIVPSLRDAINLAKAAAR